MFKISSMCSNAEVKAWHISLHCGHPLMCRNLPHFLVNSVHQLLQVRVKFTMDFLLQQGKQAVIRWIEVRAIWRVGHLRQVHLCEPGLDWQRPVGRCSVMQDSPIPCPPHSWAVPVNSITQLLKNLQVQLTINSLTLRNKLAVHQALVVKKNKQPASLSGQTAPSKALHVSGSHWPTTPCSPFWMQGPRHRTRTHHHR